MILDAELVKVPTVKENGMTDVGKSQFSNGTKIKLAPPPQIALIQNAIIVAPKSNMVFRSILPLLNQLQIYLCLFSTFLIIFFIFYIE